MAKRTDPVKKRRATDRPSELVIITGLSGSGKGSVLKALEDLGYYSVDNLPVDLIPKFAELTQDSASIRAAALVVDVREGEGLKRFPAIFTRIRNRVKTRLIFLEADDNAILRRFSETRRPHPLGTENSIAKSIRSERRQLAPIRAMADLIVNTSKFTVHELRDFIKESFRGERDESKMMVYVTSFGYRHGVPADSDLVFDVRFLPNPNYIPRVQETHRTASQGGEVHPLVPADRRVHRSDLRLTDLPDAALHPRRQELSDDCVWLHRRPSSFGDDRGCHPQAPGASRLSRKDHPSGRRQSRVKWGRHSAQCHLVFSR